MRKRNLSEFMCIEMLYDYKMGLLDPLRAQAVEECIQNSPRVREELKKLSQGLIYCDKLKSIKVSQPLIENISNRPRVADKAIKHLSWKALPQPIRWGVEGVIVSVALVLFVFQYEKLFKSDKVKEQSVVYKKFDLHDNEEISPRQDIVSNEKQVADTTVNLPASAEATQVASSVTTEKVIPDIQVEDRKVFSEIPLVLAPIVEKDVIVAKTAATSTTTTSQEVEQVTKKEPRKGNAYVYRMAMYIENVDKITPELVEFISGLGGKKAGEVELGWRRKGGSYFHFTIPQENNAALQEGLKKYANFNIIKSNHPRVMPEGIERFILWVEEKKSADADSATSDAGSEEGQSLNEEQSVDGNQAP